MTTISRTRDILGRLPLPAAGRPREVRFTDTDLWPRSETLATLHRRHQARSGRMLMLAGALLAPRRVGMYFPANARNPYQTLLYSEAPVRMVPLRTLDRLDSVPGALLPSFLHLHWEEALLAGRDPVRAAEDAMRRLGRLDEAGTKLVLTVHNARPHDSMGEAERDAFHRVRQFVLDRAALVHVHSQAARRHLCETYEVDPARVATIAHPSYLQWYAERQPADALPEKRRLLVFGIMRGYKNVDRILQAVGSLGEDANIGALTIAGAGELGGVAPEGLARIRLEVRSTFVAEKDIPALFGAADFAVFAQARNMTSGSITLACSLGVPPIVPRNDSLTEALPPEIAPLIYEPEEPGALAAALRRAGTMPFDQYRALQQALAEAMRKIAPARQSALLFQAMKDAGAIR